ncbi:MAG TPA: amino acid adenylation domain-containing protein, partial [Steroidobacter sp.]|uniref:amino acid adenylation domain-containing protein n=1 Tax=Steroidobacter sp. TaxID=1978227 RepID=UPI002EDA1A4F
HTAWAMVVAACSGRSDVVFGTVLSGRLQGTSGVQDMLGMFINTLPLRLRLEGMSVVQMVAQVERALRDLLPYEQAPLSLAQQCSGLAANASLFSALLNYRHSHSVAGPFMDGAAADDAGITLIHAQERTNYPFIASIDDSDKEFSIDVQVDRSIDPHRVIGYLEAALTGLIGALQEQPGKSVLSVSVLPASEQHQLLREWNATQAVYPQEDCLHELFEAQVAKTPNNTAVVYEDERLTYAELNDRANRLAHYLREAGVTADTLVGLCVERSLEMVVGLLGILKAGGAYVPLDPGYPRERLAYLIEDSGVQWLLTQDALLERIGRLLAEHGNVRVLSFDGAELQSELQRRSADNLHRSADQSSRNLAYVIYTSGSTGLPKGVMIEHGNVTRLFAASATKFDFSSQDIWTLFHSFAFDFSVWEIWGALLHGGQLVVVPHWVTRSPSDFYELLERERVTVLNQTPRAFELLIAVDGERQASLNLRYVIFGGEALNIALLQPWVDRHGAAAPQLINMYGITETTVHVTYRRLLSADIYNEDNPSVIGHVLPDLSAVVLTLQRSLAPLGTAGELYVGGAGLARGYLNRPQLTAERFIDNPFHDPNHPKSSARLYKTGDLVRYLPDGNLEYLGRIDDQVKIRGFRIELGEIESQLTQHEQVAAAVVLAREVGGSEKRLVAYVTTKQGGHDSGQELIAALKARLESTLPDYMVPALFVVLDELPLTSSGKIDKKALPAPDASSLAIEYAAARTQTERQLVELCAQLLQLKPEEISTTANFFALGGHSLLVMRLVSSLQQIGLKADVKTIYGAASLRALAAALDDAASAEQSSFSAPANLIPPACDRIEPSMLPLVSLSEQEIERIVATVPGGAKNVQDIYPLAPLQAGLLFFHRLHRQNDPYLLSTLFCVENGARFDALKAALQRVIDRHDVLRTAVVSEDVSTPVQVVYRQADLPIEMLELDPAQDAVSQMRARFDEPQVMDISRAPMLRIRAARDPRSAKLYVLLQIHHLIEDITSAVILETEVRACLAGQADRLPSPIPYRHFVAHALHQARHGDAETFFRRTLGDVTESTAPFNLIDVRGDGTDIVEARKSLDPLLAQRIRQTARHQKFSPAVLFHTAWAMVVAACSGRSDVVFGTVLSGRLQGTSGVQDMLGMFINTLPLRLRLEGMTVVQMVAQVDQALRELLPYEQAPLSLAQQCSGLAASASLFSALLNYRHSQSVAGAFMDDGITLIHAQERTNYPFIASIDDSDKEFSIDVQVDHSIDPHHVIGYLEAALAGLIGALQEQPGQSVLSVSVLPASEQYQLLREWNATHAEYPQEDCLHELFEAQVAKTPNHTAVVYEDEWLTYAELNDRANRLAHYLRGAGVTPDTLVGLCVERSLEMVVGLLGILKAGGAYVPLDPGYPRERLVYMIEDSGMQWLLTQDALLEQAGQLLAEQARVRVLSLDGAELQSELQRCSAENPRRSADQSSRNLAYVIYTSGSTGQPKGVMIEHQAVVNFLHSMQRDVGIDQSDVLLSVTSLSFDIAALELYLPLTVGARTVLATRESARQPEHLFQLIEHRGITIMQATPSTWRMLADHGWPRSSRPLKALCGGEALSDDLAGRLLRHMPALWNLYGPTETTIWSTVHYITAQQPEPLIGRPLANTQLYVLDAQRNPVPIGVAGELHIGGAGLARGYLNRPELTAERFIINPFHDRSEPASGERLYTTGDRVRYLPDGNLEYLGRSDDQVKIRGFRIELGEIENQLMQHPDVGAAVVLAREDVAGHKMLVAYVTTRADRSGVTQALTQRLEEHLRGVLPEYMVPALFVVLEELPLTPNGKIDKKSLPAPDADAAQAEYVAPRTRTEQRLVAIWADLLEVEPEAIGATANFFALGGNSLLSIPLVAEVRKHFDIELDIKRIFDTTTLSALAAAIDASASKAQRPQVTMVERQGNRVPLSFAQQRMWFLDRLDEGGAHYNMPLALRVSGRFDIAVAEQAFQRIIERHEPLRTVFGGDGDQVWQE